MDMITGERHKRHNEDQLAHQLAPLEEQDKQAAAEQVGKGLNSDPDYGAIVVDNVNLKIPNGITEEQDEKRFWGLEPVVLVVLILTLGFIAFIAWQITLMPQK
jgi:hypothetical protein